MINTHERTFKTTTVDYCYCLPKYLNRCISDFKKIAEKANLYCYLAKFGEDFLTPNHQNFALIGIQAKESEYYLILNFYKEVRHEK